MPRRAEDPVETGEWPNVLAKGTSFSGTIEVTDSIRLEGKFDGEVRTEGTLYVVPNANVEGKIEASVVVIGGNFKGEVVCERRVDLEAECRATGRLTTRALTVQDGALFDGDIIMAKRSASATPSAAEPVERQTSRTP
jgi:cytoskeletal protein CcmA (bactofilin family)